MSKDKDNRASTEGLASRVSALPYFELIESAGESPTYLVGGAVRDLLLGRRPIDLDFAVDGPLEPVLESLDGDVTRHEQFETASVRMPDDVVIDFARTRSESYAEPGALPKVRPARVEVDLGRRDFTINAMAVPLGSPEHLIDPHDGQRDLERGLLRALHLNSFRDDPTRALRAARYAARLGMEIEEGTESQLDDLDLGSVSMQRISSEILLSAGEECACGSLSKAVEWGLLAVPEGHPRLLADICDVLDSPVWESYLESVGLEGPRVLAEAVAVEPSKEFGSLAGAEYLFSAQPATGSEAASLAEGHSPSELVMARALGAAWLDGWCEDLRSVTLEIGGDDLVAAGVPAGPLVGIGLAAAMSAKLNGQLKSGSDELEVALDACRTSRKGAE